MSKGNKPQKEQTKKKQFIIFGLCSFVALVLCMVTLVVTVKRIEGDTYQDPSAENKVSATILKNDFATLSDYAKKLTDLTQRNQFVKISSYTDVSVDDSSVKVTDTQGAEVDNSLVIYAKNKIMPTVDSWYDEDYTGKFGDMLEVRPVVNLTDAENTASNYTTGLADENGAPVFDDEGVLVDEDFYYVTFKMNGAKASIKSADTFRTKSLPEVGEMLKKELSTVCKINKSTVAPADFGITLKVNRFTDKIDYLEVTRVYNVMADVSFIGDMSTFGEKSIEFTYKVTEHFDYYYAGISFTNQPLRLDVGEEAVLSVNAVMEDDSDYQVKFISTDESVIVVDEMGYVTALKESEEPVYVTVTLCYMGKIFTDKCPVYVNGEDS